MFVNNNQFKYYTELKKDIIRLANITDIVKRKNVYVDGNRRTVSYYNIPCSLDIETTSFIQDDKKVACMYIWQLGINGGCYYGRTWDEFLECLEIIDTALDLDECRRIRFYVHNLAFEFSFIKKLLEWDDVFSINNRKVLYARSSGFEFFCSYLLTNMSLKSLAKNCNKYPCKKLNGNLFDYDKIRHSKTPLTQYEMDYAREDIKIVMNYIKEQIEKEGTIYNIPLTSTGYVRRDVYNKCTQSKYYIKYINSLTFNIDEYKELIRPAFSGGFTHASNINVAKTIKDVHHVDYTSKYPYCLLAYEMPCSNPFPFNMKTTEELDKLEHKVVFFKIKLKSLSSKFHYEHYLSVSKCKFYDENNNEVSLNKALQNIEVDNGRIDTIKNGWSVEFVTTSIDWQIIKNVYEWEKEEIINAIAFYTDTIPERFASIILEYYSQKTVLKDVEGVEEEYAKFKAFLNSIYGFVCTDPIQSAIIYNQDSGKWNLQENQDEEKIIEKYNKSYKRTIYYPWSVVCTAYARRDLWGLNYDIEETKNVDEFVNNFGIYQLKNDYIYADTDSLFFTHLEKYNNYINNFNDSCSKMLKNAFDTYTSNIVNFEDYSPKNKYGKSKPLGVWTFEPHIEIFKTLGAKRYLLYVPEMPEGDKLRRWNEETQDYDGDPLDLYLTVSGLDKTVGINYFIDTYETVDKIFEAFDFGLEIEAEVNGKLSPVYTDEAFDYTLTDYLGNTYTGHEESCCHLAKQTYSIKLNETYEDYFLSEQSNFRY